MKTRTMMAEQIRRLWRRLTRSGHDTRRATTTEAAQRANDGCAATRDTPPATQDATEAAEAVSLRKAQEEKGTKQPVRLTREVRAFLQEHYDLRYNLLTDETEYRPAGCREVPFVPIGKRELNTLCLEAHEHGIPCWDKDLSRYVYSTCIPDYHPFRLYMDELPAWDGKERMVSLARRVSDNALWSDFFHRWMLGLAAQWAGKTGVHANSMAPVLVSSRQGLQKSTFCKVLMPPVLSRYYTDSLKLAATGRPEHLLAEMGLVNMDEFDKYTPQQMPLLKNLMQMADLNIRKVHQKNFRRLPRVASFIATSNRFDLLTDPTGSRRFICVEVKHTIDCEGIEHEQIFAQLKAELEQGVPHWLSKEEEKRLQMHNRTFYRSCPAEEVFHSCYCAARADEEGCEQLSAALLFQRLTKCHPAAMRGSNPATFGRLLLAAGIPRKHTKLGNVYLVKPVTPPPAA